MRKLKIGLIGCGKIARISHAPEFLKLKNKAEITGIFDLNQENMTLLQSENRIAAEPFASADELLASGVDGVVICTPNSTHYELTVKALKAGVHVLVEKPMAATLQEADNMIALAKKRKLVLQVNQTLRFTPVHRKIKELIDAGKIGVPIHIRCFRAAAASPDKTWSQGAEWFVRKKFAGGIIMDIAVHMADIMGWYFGEVERIFSINGSRNRDSDVPDNVSAVFEFANGATGVLELSWTIPTGGSLLEIYGSGGMLRLGFNADELELSTGSASGSFKAVKVQEAETSQEWFIDSIDGKSGCPSPGEIGRHALALCLAIAKSGDTGSTIDPDTQHPVKYPAMMTHNCKNSILPIGNIAGANIIL